MHRKGLRYGGRGFVPLEMLAVVCVIAILLGLGVVVVQNAREQAHLAQAEGSLRQVSIGLDLYYKKYNAFPEKGCNLAEALAEFVQNPKVFENVLMPDTEAGYTLSRMYAEPTSGSFDEPENVITALLSADGSSIVLLKTLGKVECHTGVSYDPHSLISSRKVANQTLLRIADYFVDGALYIVENEDGRDAVTVKLEAVDDQLGDENDVEAHVFRIPVETEDGASLGSVDLTLKAGTEAVEGRNIEVHEDGGAPSAAEDCVDTCDYVQIGDFHVNCAFEGSDLVITILSDCRDDGRKTPALSNWTCRVPEGVHIVLPGGREYVDVIKFEM